MWLNPQEDRIALLKTEIDVHTLGISTIQEILEECGFTVYLSDEKSVPGHTDRGSVRL